MERIVTIVIAVVLSAIISFFLYANTASMYSALNQSLESHKEFIVELCKNNDSEKCKNLLFR